MKHLRWYCIVPRGRPLWLKQLEAILHHYYARPVCPSTEQATLEELASILYRELAQLRASPSSRLRANVWLRLVNDEDHHALHLYRGHRPLLIFKIE